MGRGRGGGVFQMCLFGNFIVKIPNERNIFKLKWLTQWTVVNRGDQCVKQLFILINDENEAIWARG